jgi:hypothetical protein
MGFYTTLYFRAAKIHPDYRAAIEKVIALQREYPMTAWSGMERTGGLRPYLTGAIFDHPFFKDERWHHILGDGPASTVDGAGDSDVRLREEGVEDGQARMVLLPIGEEPALVIAVDINYGHTTVGLFLHWVCCGVLGVKTWVTDENRVFEGPFFFFEGETLLPSDLLVIRALPVESAC